MPKLIGTFSSYQGPLLLAPDRLRRSWLHRAPDEIDDAITAFDRKIERRRAGVMEIEGSLVLVLESTHPTRFVPSGSGGFLVRLINHADPDFDDDDQAGVAAAVESGFSGFKKWKPLLALEAKEPLVLFESFSAVPDDDQRFKRSIAVGLKPGHYQVDLARGQVGECELEALRLYPRGGKPPLFPTQATPPKKKLLRIGLTPELRRLARRLSWIATDGGPMLIAPRAIAKTWRGARDYHLVMDMYSLATLDFGGGELLVLPRPLPTAWIAERALLVRADQGSPAQRVAVALESPVRWKAVATLDCGRKGELVCFDAAGNGSQAKLQLRVLPGKCRVEVSGKLRAVVPDPQADEDELTVDSLIRFRGR